MSFADVLPWVNNGIAVLALVCLARWAAPRIDRLIDSHVGFLGRLEGKLTEITDDMEKLGGSVDDLSANLMQRINHKSDLIRAHDERIKAIETKLGTT